MPLCHYFTVCLQIQHSWWTESRSCLQDKVSQHWSPAELGQAGHFRAWMVNQAWLSESSGVASSSPVCEPPSSSLIFWHFKPHKVLTWYFPSLILHLKTGKNRWSNWLMGDKGLSPFSWPGGLQHFILLYVHLVLVQQPIIKSFFYSPCNKCTRNRENLHMFWSRELGPSIPPHHKFWEAGSPKILESPESALRTRPSLIISSFYQHSICFHAFP